jgi:hypothetical protein
VLTINVFGYAPSFCMNCAGSKYAHFKQLNINAANLLSSISITSVMNILAVLFQALGSNLLWTVTQILNVGHN